MTIAQLFESFIALLLALFKFNVTLTFFAILFAFPVASILAFGRLSKYKIIYYPVSIYINVLRSSPLLMVMFWTYYTAPMLLGGNVNAFHAALIGLTAFEAAYFAEFIRSGLQSVRANQRTAGLATGLKPWQVSYYIVWPQAIRRMLPSLLSQSIIAFQDSTLASIIGVREVVRTTAIINAREVKPIMMYTMLAAIYLLLCFLLSRLVKNIDKRSKRRAQV
jgi:glutamate/aspartate transport system permease protein